MEAIVKCKNISFSYNKQNQVLSDINFEIDKNDFVGLIGPNGGGKTTLLKIILGLLKPINGSVEIFGKSPKLARSRIGYVPQYSQIDLNYPITAWEVVMFGFLGNKRIGSAFNLQEKQKATDILTSLKLFDIKDRTIGELSGGQRQRIMIARALVRDPELLILDEPTNNVDEESGRDLYELLADLNKNMAIIIVSHDIDTISKNVSKVFCLNKTIVCNRASEVTTEYGDPKLKKIHHKHKWELK